MGTGLYKAGGGKFVPKTQESDEFFANLPTEEPSSWSIEDPTDGSGNGNGKSNNYKFANALATKRFEFDMGKFLIQQAKDDAETKATNEAIKLKKANADAQRAAMQKRYDSGEYAKGFEEQLAGLEQLGQYQQTNINSQRDSALGEITGGYDQAGNMVGTGFDQLTQYLKDNPNNPYNDQTYGAGKVGNDLSALLASQGAPNDPVNAQVQATQSGLDAGAKEFNDLNKMLSTIAQGSAGSRLSEATIGRNQALTGLAQQKAGQEGSVKSKSADALTKMWANITEGKIDVKANQAQAKSDLEEWLATNVSVDLPPDSSDSKDDDAAVGKKPRTSFANVVAADHPNFTGTLEEAKKKFPKLLKEVASSRVAAKK